MKPHAAPPTAFTMALRVGVGSGSSSSECGYGLSPSYRHSQVKLSFGYISTILRRTGTGALHAVSKVISTHPYSLLSSISARHAFHFVPQFSTDQLYQSRWLSAFSSASS